MFVATDLRRLALLLALLPQLLVLGLGRGVVVCIAADGHVQMEVVGSECCAGSGTSTTDQDSDLAVAQDEPDCGPCVDLQITPDREEYGSSKTRSVELSSGLALPVEAPVFSPTASLGRLVESHVDRGRVPAHLIHLHSVQLLC